MAPTFQPHPITARRLGWSPLRESSDHHPFNRSFQACSLSLQGWGLISPTARNVLTRPPIGTPRRANSPGEGLLILFTSRYGSGQGCPLLRASNEHSFTVRALRARRAPGRSLPTLLRPRVARAQEIVSPYPLGFRTHLYIEQFDFPMEMTPFDFQIFSRARYVPVMLAQLSRDIFLFKRIAGVPKRVIRLCEEWIDRWSCRLGCGPNRARLQRKARLSRIDDGSRCHDHQSFD